MSVPATTGSAEWVALESAGVITRRALYLPDTISENEMLALGAMFSDIDDTSRFLLGDLLVDAGNRYGDDFLVTVMEATGLAHQTCENMASICRRVRPPVRRQELRFHTHAVVASLVPSEQERLLELAVVNGWTRQRLRDEVHGERVLPPAAVNGSLPDVVRDAISGARNMDDMGWLISNDSYVRLRSCVEGEE